MANNIPQENTTQRNVKEFFDVYYSAPLEFPSNEVDAVIDCGYGKNVASTVVDCRNEQIKIIRQGAGILPN